ncbi:MAG: hypothetical protein HYR88_02755 [Verrucomicrobia bacterium]|nr:hypothetical protein [Verrucomicrobiota bacterium]MBI3868695.1 hypothetical protein [Verrucomicrobiota bacterium]
MMKATIHTITTLLLLTLSAMAGPFLKVRTERQRAIIDAQVPPNMELRLFVGDDSLGWSAAVPQRGVAVSATVEGSHEIRLEDGSLGKGFIFRAGGSTTYVAITPGGPVPFGEFIIRDDSKVTRNDGTATFADIRKPDGMLVPVSIGVRTVQPHANPGVVTASSPGAATNQSHLGEFSPVRFRILEITQHGDPVNGQQTTALRVTPHYGKIGTQSHDFRLRHETQNPTVVTAIDTGYDIRTNTIIGVQVSQHLKIGP